VTGHFTKVQELLKLEALAIQHAADRLDEASVSKAIELITPVKARSS